MSSLFYRQGKKSLVQSLVTRHRGFFWSSMIQRKLYYTESFIVYFCLSAGGVQTPGSQSKCPLFFSHTVTLSHCHTVTLSHCPTVTPSHCHTVTLSQISFSGGEPHFLASIINASVPGEWCPTLHCSAINYTTLNFVLLLYKAVQKETICDKQNEEKIQH